MSHRVLMGMAASCLTIVISGCKTDNTLPSTADSEFSRLYGKGKLEALEIARQPSTLETTHRRILRRIDNVRGGIAGASDEDRIDDYEDELEILGYLTRLVSETKKSNPGSKKIQSVNLQVERILNLMEDPDAGSSAPHRFHALFTGMVPTAIVGHRIPAPARGGESLPIGRKGAEKESAFLYSSEKKDFYRVDELASMTPDEIAMLDVSPEHPAFHPSDTIPSDPIRTFEKSMESGIRDVLLSDDDLPRGTKWDLERSRRILFIDEVYKSATSAKARTEDPYGAEWKIKWGDEVQSEAVSSRLYLQAGGKMTDLSFAGGGGPEHMVLILGKDKKYDPDDEEKREPATLEQLSESLDDFYGFDLAPYVHSHGVIDKNNANTVLANLASNVRKKYRRENLIGRQWVSFKEFSLELRPKGLVRNIDGAYLTDLGGSRDRAARGLYLFSLWIASRDAKDDNNKTYFMKSPGNNDEYAGHFEGQHDLGVSLGTMGAAGKINGLKTGDEFLRRSFTGRKIVGRETFVYKPKAFWEATWSDSKWMASRISKISDEDLREAIATSLWPDFMQEVLFYKLTSRRNQILKVFGLEERGTIMPPDITLDLQSPEKVRGVERKYGLVPGSLINVSGRKKTGYRIERIVKDGEVVGSDKSEFIRQLTIQKHPAGLADRYRRLFNKQPKALRD